jgi:hypothetical protein
MLTICFHPSDPWILLAVAKASFHGSCSLPRLISAADYINHAIPSRAQIEGGVNRLAAAGLLSVSKNGFSLAPKGRRLMIGLESKSRSLPRQWKMLEKELPAIGPLTRRARRWRLSPAVYRQAVAEHLRPLASSR